MNTQDFDRGLDHLVASIGEMLLQEDYVEYLPTVWVIDQAGNISIDTLVQLDEMECDFYKLAWSFGQALKQSNRNVAAVYIAGESQSAAGDESIAVTGMTIDGKENAANLSIERSPSGAIGITCTDCWHHSSDTVFEGRRAAAEAIRGYRSEF